MKYIYECEGKIKQLKDDDETKLEHNTYFVIVCKKCCNVPVFHLLKRGEIKND
jgi:hypothetical protein